MIKFLAFFFLALAASQAQAGEPAVASAPDDRDLSWGACPEFFPAGCEIAVAHGDPAEPNADIFFRVPGGYEIPAHWHTSAERMVLVSGALDVTYEGQDVTHLEEGMYAYGPPEAVHDGRCVSEADCVLVIAFEEPVDAYPVEP